MNAIPATRNDAWGEEDFFPCETCDYMKYNPDTSLGVHCYMFLHKPVRST